MLKKKIRVLVFPCGAENALEIYQALRYSIHVEIYGASSVDDHGRFRFENYIGNLPKISQPSFDEKFTSLIHDNQIDLVFSTHDTVCEYLAPRAQHMGFYLVNGDVETTRITRSKKRTYDLFAGQDWLPRIYSDLDAVTHWPVIAKPDAGQGGQQVKLFHDAAELLAGIHTIQEPVLVEYLPGEEITIDCFTDRNRKLVFCGPRSRERIRAGIAMRSVFYGDDGSIADIAAEINAKISFRGPWFFQLKRARDRVWKLLEVSSRIAGTMSAQRARGVNLPLLTIQDFLERDVSVLPEYRVTLVDRSICTRAELDYEFDTVYVDLDDTLVIDGFATPLVISYLYQMIKAGKRLVLITRHAADVQQTLLDARIAVNLFNEIIHITDGVSKAGLIGPRSIFIDNYFVERLSVATECAVPVLDVDMLEFLIR